MSKKINIAMVADEQLISYYEDKIEKLESRIAYLESIKHLNEFSTDKEPETIPLCEGSATHNLQLAGKVEVEELKGFNPHLHVFGQMGKYNFGYYINNHNLRTIWSDKSLLMQMHKLVIKELMKEPK